MKATGQQMAIAANLICQDSDSREKAGMWAMFNSLFPDSIGDLNRLIQLHPITVRWDEYRKTPWSKRHTFLLDES